MPSSIAELAPEVFLETDRLFPGCTGRGVRLAVIDSGVNPHHPHINGIAGGVSIRSDGTAQDEWRNPSSAGKSCLDTLGHGTAVTAAVQDLAPGVAVFVVKLFHDDLRTTGDALVASLAWAIEAQMDVINLSLGTRNPSHREHLSRLADQANAAGSIIVAAREARGEPCYPGSLPGVISVRMDRDLAREQFRCEEEVFYASGYPRSVPGVPPSCNLQGVSFAVANMSGLVARAREHVGCRSTAVLLDALWEVCR